MTTNTVETRTEPSNRKRLRRFVGLFAFGAGLTLGAATAEAQSTEKPSLNRDAFLKAVAEVETGGNPRAVGRHGERGLYQFTYATWRRHSSRPFTDAHNPRVAHDVAVRHFVWLHDRLTAAGREPDAYQMAVAWNGGVARAISGKAPRTTRSYATRVANIAAIVPARTAPVAVAVNNPAPRRATTSSPRPIASASRPEPTRAPAPTVKPVRFDFDPGPEALAGDDAPVVALEEVPEEVPFSLAPRTPAATSESAPARRVIFATIGD